MKRIVIWGALSLIGLGAAFAQEKSDSVKVVSNLDLNANEETKVVKNNGDHNLHMPSGKVIGVQNKARTWFVGIEPSLDFGWSRFNSNDISSDDQSTVSDLSLEKGAHFGLNIFKGDFNITKNGVLKFNSALGIDYNSYHFRKSITLQPAQPILTYTIDESISYKKNILRSTYATMPFMLSLGNSKFNVMAGYELSVLLSGKTKQIIERNKIKERDNFNLNPFRQGLVFRMNYGCLGFYAKYYLTNVFVDNQGPRGLQNFNLGISLGGF